MVEAKAAFYKYKQEKINPYRLFARQSLLQMRRRVLWDLNPLSWDSRNKLRKVKNRYAGKKAVILGNGPSLLKHDLSILDGHFTFGQNKINLLFEKFDFRPSCIVSIDPIILEQNSSFFNETRIPIFLSSVSSKFIGNRENVTFLYVSELGRGSFARDCSFDVVPSGSVTHISLQLAFHMGFSDVALIGCDHNYQSNQPAGSLVEAKENDLNHFHPNYYQPGQKWQVSSVLHLELGYTLARDVFAAYGRRVVNCTQGGQLEVFERKSLESWIAESI